MAKRVFIIVREKFLRTLFEQALRAKGMEVYTTENLKDQSYQLSDFNPNLIICDLESIEESDEWGLMTSHVSQNIKILSLGSLDKKSQIEEKFNFHFSGHLNKPLEVNLLADKIYSFMKE